MAEQTNTTNAAKYKAKKLGIDLTEVAGTGYERLITMRDALQSKVDA